MVRISRPQYDSSCLLRLENATTRVAAIVSNSDAKATRSIMCFFSTLAEVPGECACILLWNRALRYNAQRRERLKGVRAGAWELWLVCILWCQTNSNEKMKRSAGVHKRSGGLASSPVTLGNNIAALSATNKCYRWIKMNYRSTIVCYQLAKKLPNAEYLNEFPLSIQHVNTPLFNFCTIRHSLPLTSLWATEKENHYCEASHEGHPLARSVVKGS